MKKTIKRIITAVVAISLVAGIVVGGGYLVQLTEARAQLEAQEREALMEQRIQDIIADADAEKQSLLDQIDELMTEEVVVFDAAPIKEQILEIGELATVTYCYTNVGTVDSVKQFSFVDWNVPFSEKEIVVSMDGVLKVGIDVTKVDIVTDEATKTITITIPEATILSNELDEKSMIVHVEDEQLFSNITLADSSSVRIEIKSKAEERALEQGLLEEARTKAGEIVRNLIVAVPSVKDTYTTIVR